MPKQLKDYLLEAVKGKLFYEPIIGDIYRIESVQYDPILSRHIFKISCFFPNGGFVENTESVDEEFNSISFIRWEATPEQVKQFQEAEKKFKQSKLEKVVGSEA